MSVHLLMNTLMILCCHSLSICLSILLNKIHRLVIYLEARLVSPSLLRAPGSAPGRGFVFIKYFWMNQWALKDPEIFLFPSFSWPWLGAPHVWCNLAPFTLSFINEDPICEISLISMLTEPYQKRCLESSEPDCGLRAPSSHWEITGLSYCHC